MNINEQANFIWSIADLLRGDFKQSEYGKVILPFTVLRRFDCVLAPSKARILEANKTLTVSNKRPIFKRTTGHDYYNISQFDFEKLMDDSNAIEANLRDYINGFSEDVREIMDNFEIFGVIDKLSRANLLYLVVQRFAEIDMSDTQIDNLEMGYMFEELIRRFSEQSNETAGEHFTPREVIELMVEVLLDPDMDEIATTDGKVITILDPACGTGGMLSVAQNKMQALNATTRVIPFGQELNPETYATCCSDMILKGNTNSRIVLGNSFNEDGFQGQTFDYMLSNPPFGVEWKKVEKFIKDEAKNKGYSGRFGAGLPRISDGSFLFLQHLISKMNAPENGGSRIGIVFNGSPMFSGDAGSGESEIRRWIIENDLLEAIIGLPDQLFYTTCQLKDSGIEWLGYIPSHWSVVPAKALFAQSKETRHETDVQLTASQKYGIISQEDYMEKQSYKIVLADKGLENWKHVEPNDFIISLRSFQGGLEISYIPGCITWHYIVLKPKAGVEPEYFKWLFKSPRYIQALQRTANFIRDGQDLRFSNFVQVPLPLIPMDEQKEIADYLNKKTARIDSIIADVTEQIEKLKEYRQSIISEVVTGKVAVG